MPESRELTNLINRAYDLIDSYEFHMSDVIDCGRRVVHHTNALYLRQLQDALRHYEESIGIFPRGNDG